MFGIGFSELLVIFVVILLIFGADKIPEFARGLAKTINQVKHATNEIKSEITKNVDDSGIVKNIKGNFSAEEMKKRVGLEDFKRTVDLNIDELSPLNNVTKEIEKAKETLEDLTGPIRRSSR